MSANLKEISDHTGLDKAKNQLPSEAYPVVIADVTYGLNKKQSRGDEVAWSSEDFQGVFAKVKARFRTTGNVCDAGGLRLTQNFEVVKCILRQSMMCLFMTFGLQDF